MPYSIQLVKSWLLWNQTFAEGGEKKKIKARPSNNLQRPNGSRRLKSEKERKTKYIESII